MARSTGWILALALATMPGWAGAEGLAVAFRDVVEPDAGLQAFVRQLKSLAVTADKPDYEKADALFAPRVKTFQKSLDPFQPWTRSDDITSHYLGGAANVIVEQGDLEEGAPVPDYRPDALKMIIEQVSKGEPFGTMRQAPGAVCAPADYKVDRKSAMKFARKYELDAYSLRFFAGAVTLHEKPDENSRVLETVPPYTLMMFDYDPKAKQPWSLYEASGGMKGYLKEDRPVLGLAQHHVCFGKVKGRYRIVALFGYGL